MINLKQRIKAFEKLGCFIRQFTLHQPFFSYNEVDKNTFHEFAKLIENVYIYNGWFTKENVLSAIDAIAKFLEKDKMEKWISGYDINKSGKNIGVIMAGNIPMAGFHDFLCVLISGNNITAKLSSNDKHLLPFIANVLIEIEPSFKEYIVFTDGQLKNIDAVIATGSNNSSRYFDYYFGKYPHIIRKNRHSIAVLTGKETMNELKKLGKDIFQYFGLGCRNVSKLMVPEGYNFTVFFEAIFDYNSVTVNNKYANNYDYNKTVYLLNGEKLLDNGFLLLKEDIGLSSPVAVLYYEFYGDELSLKERIKMDLLSLQCIISGDKNNKGAIDFGNSQCPELSDYSDGVDTMKFLIDL